MDLSNYQTVQKFTRTHNHRPIARVMRTNRAGYLTFGRAGERALEGCTAADVLVDAKAGRIAIVPKPDGDFHPYRTGGQVRFTVTNALRQAGVAPGTSCQCTFTVEDGIVVVDVNIPGRKK